MVYDIHFIVKSTGWGCDILGNERICSCSLRIVSRRYKRKEAEKDMIMEYTIIQRKEDVKDLTRFSTDNNPHVTKCCHVHYLRFTFV